MSNNIEFDLPALMQLSPKALNEKTDRIGYCKKDGHTYVLTTQSAAQSSEFVSRVDSIAKLLYDAEISEEQFSQLSAEHSIKVVEYIDCIYRIFDRHNAKVEVIIEKSWVRYLACIPLIGRVVRWIFDSLSLPQKFLSRFFTLQEKPIQSYLATPPCETQEDTLALLDRCKQLDKWRDECEESCKELRGNGHREWNITKDLILRIFEEQLAQKIPQLQLSRKIIDAAKNDPKDNHAAILNLSADDGIPEAFEKSNKLLQELQWDGALSEAVTETLQKQNGKAKFVVLEGFKGMLSISQPVRTYFDAATDVNDLLQRKKTVRTYVEEQRVAQNRLGLDETVIWTKPIEVIDAVFDELLDEKVAEVKLARTLLTAPCKDPEKTYREILQLADDEDVAQAPNKCNEVLKKLKWDASLRDVLTDTQKQQCEEAKKVAVKAYAQWQVQRICRLQEKETSPSLEKLLVTSDSTQFEKKYLSLSERLKSLETPTAKKALQILASAYFKHVDGPYIQLEKKITKDPFIFKEFPSAEEMLTMYNFYLQVLQDRKLFGQTAVSTSARIDYDIAGLKEKLTTSYHARLRQLMPVFGEATLLMNVHQSTVGMGSDVPRLTHQSETASPLQSKQWYEHKISLFDIEIAQPDYEKKYSSEAWKIILDAKKKLLADFSTVTQKQLVDSLKPAAKPVSFFDKLLDLFGDDVKDQPLKCYRENMVRILEIKEFKDNAELERKYKEKLASIAQLPNSEGMKTLLEDAYSHYQRATKIQPLLGKSFSLDDLLKIAGKQTSQDLLVIEKVVNEFMELLDTELACQKTKPKNPLVPLVERAKQLLQDGWDKMLFAQFPAYTTIKKINASVKDKDPEHLYRTLLNLNLKTTCREANTQYDTIYSSIQIKGENQPITLQKAYVETAKWLLLAFKEWEADRILNLGITVSPGDSEYVAKEKTDKILGVASDTSSSNRKKRWRTLKLFLHTDKNTDVPTKIKDKLDEGGKIIPDLK